MQISVTQATRPTSCPLCRGDLPVGRSQVCEGCGTAYHRACLFDLGGCGTIGCPRRGERPPPLRAAPRGGAGAAYLVVGGVALATLVGLLFLSQVGVFVHGARRAPRPVAARPARTAPARPRPPAPPLRTRPAPLPEPAGATPLRTVRRPGRLDEVTRAMERVRLDYQLLDTCAAAERGGVTAWARRPIEERLARLDDEARADEARASEADLQAALRGRVDAVPATDARPADPIAELQLRVRQAREGGASEGEVEAALRRIDGASTAGAAHDEAILAAVAGREPSPLTPSALAPRLRRALATIDREDARAAAARAYADALERSIDRDRVVARLEALLADPEVVFPAAEWRERFAGPDPHEEAREARRRFLAAGGPDRPDPLDMNRAQEMLVALHLEKARWVLGADDASPTPTQRLLAAIEARAARPRPR